MYNHEKAKVDGIKAALVSFRKFHPSDVEESSCTKDLFEEFASHLLTCNYALGTMTQYLSGVFNFFKQKYTTLGIWNEDVIMNSNGSAPKWYLNIRNRIQRTIMDKVIQEGGKLQDKSEPIGRNLT